MKILYITTVFPRPEDDSTIYTDLACGLARCGHSVTVVAADGEDTLTVSSALSLEHGLSVLRVRTGALYNVGLVKKGIATLTLGKKLKRAIKRHLKDQAFDLVLYESPPLTTYSAVRYAKKQFRAASFLMLKDIFPQNGVDLGLYKKSSILYRLFKYQENNLYGVSDKIGCMSEENIAYMKKNAPAIASKLVYFPNTKAMSDAPTQTGEDIRKMYHLPKDKTIFLFGGNIGIPQSPENIITCAKQICATENGFFLAVGRGTHTALVRDALKEEKNALVLPNLPRREFDILLHACDVGLIFLDKRFTVPNFPSRILSYMNSAMPVLAVTDTVCDINKLLKAAQCGIWCQAEDSASFSDAVAQLCQSEARRKQMGKCGFSYFKDHFTVEKSVQLLEHYHKGTDEVAK